jgi:hypothetical protein
MKTTEIDQKQIETDIRRPVRQKKWIGHAPDYVREMFREAINAFVNWKDGEPEPTLTFESGYEPREVTISRACGLLWNCSDILPRSDFDYLGYCNIEPKRQTYAAAARAMLESIKASSN